MKKKLDFETKGKAIVWGIISIYAIFNVMIYLLYPAFQIISSDNVFESIYWMDTNVLLSGIKNIMKFDKLIYNVDNTESDTEIYDVHNYIKCIEDVEGLFLKSVDRVEYLSTEITYYPSEKTPYKDIFAINYVYIFDSQLLLKSNYQIKRYVYDEKNDIWEQYESYDYPQDIEKILLERDLPITFFDDYSKDCLEDNFLNVWFNKKIITVFSMNNLGEFKTIDYNTDIETIYKKGDKLFEIPKKSQEVTKAMLDGEIIKSNLINSYGEFSFDDIDNGIEWDTAYLVDGGILENFKTSIGETIRIHSDFDSYGSNILMYDDDVLVAIISLNNYSKFVDTDLYIKVSNLIYSFDKTSRFRLIDIDIEDDYYIDDEYDLEMVKVEDAGIMAISEETRYMFSKYKEISNTYACNLVYGDNECRFNSGNIYIVETITQFIARYKSLYNDKLKSELQEYDDDYDIYSNIGIILEIFTDDETTYYTARPYNNDMIFFDSNIYDINDMLSAEMIDDKLYITKVDKD